MEQHRGYVLYVSDRVAGRFVSKAAAHVEETRLCNLALRDGHAITTRVVWEPPMPQTEEELRDAQIDATLY